VLSVSTFPRRCSVSRTVEQQRERHRAASAPVNFDAGSRSPLVLFRLLFLLQAQSCRPFIPWLYCRRPECVSSWAKRTTPGLLGCSNLVIVRDPHFGPGKHPSNVIMFRYTSFSVSFDVDRRRRVWVCCRRPPGLGAVDTPQRCSLD